MDNSPQLTIRDLGGIKTIIETACSRGAFAANEMSTVGSLYDRLNTFLDFIVSQSQQDEPPENTQGDQQ
jgi:hypothetical protein